MLKRNPLSRSWKAGRADGLFVTIKSLIRPNGHVLLLPSFTSLAKDLHAVHTATIGDSSLHSRIGDKGYFL